ncbi:head-tail connector protein [Altericroceibacterium endophyticum]|uniref:Phage gp6-like head-tail connector protein n=1 Tax=Altericroceibacterium endophyticum TaxID=1808508 RepID=A0A6I4T659_9SPHN|nr:hypothetical protein [Altericroceibacterium endophyticum]MXO65493.1 hypothetical protein [Altericroceibacterium endophyticum]
MRILLTAPDLSGVALADCKDWLAITGSAEDGQLLALLQAALDYGEHFTGQCLIETEWEEIHPASPGWHMLATRPVQVADRLQSVAPDDTRSLVSAQDYELDLLADGSARFRLSHSGASPHDHDRLAIRCTAGIAADWSALPAALRQGTLRLVAHLYRARENELDRPIPAAVTALWQGWRRLALC